MTPRKVILAVSSLVLVASLGCREVVARAMPKASIHAYSQGCSEGPAIGDSIQLRALVVTGSASSGMQGPLDDWTLYDSESHPRSFDWSIRAPDSNYRGKAEITDRGVLIGRDTGAVSVEVRSAGKRVKSLTLQVVPQIARFSVFPSDTSVRVGDTIIVRADAELVAPRRQLPLSWIDGPGGANNRSVDHIEQDPDNPVKLDKRELHLVAVSAGTAHIVACFGGARRDTATIRVSGEPAPVNRDAPPLVNLTPGDTTVYVGDSFAGYWRVLNARLLNGPYTISVTTGDGLTYRDSAEGRGSSSAFGFKRGAFSDFFYITPGVFSVAATVTDSAGRKTTIHHTYTARIREFKTRVILPEGERAVRLSAGDPDLTVALLSDQGALLYPAHIGSSYSADDPESPPPLLFGKTHYEHAGDGHRRVQRDVDGNGELDDLFLIDKARLRRNGDLRLGRNRMVITGVTNGSSRPGNRQKTGPIFYTPIRAIVEFEVVP